MQAWDDFLKGLESELGRETVRKWLRPMRVRHFDACNLYLEAQDSFQVMWFEEHVRKRAQQQLINPNNRKIKVHLTVVDTSEPEPLLKVPEPKKTPDAPPPFKLEFDALNETATFDGYVSLSPNELAYKLLSSLAGDVDLGAFNPIYLHGPSGTGKTHLLMATARQLRAQGLTVICVRAETFTAHVVSAIRAGEMQLFRSHYRNADVLIIDDVQVFARKNATQEELFHTFNTLHVDGRQLILSANCAPGELRAIEPRLVSRFEWGIVLPLEPPPQDQLRQILLRKAQMMRFPLSSEIVTYLIDTFQSGPSQAMQALEALALRSHLAGDNISDANPLRLPLAKSYLVDLVEQERRSEVTAEKIIDAVASHYGIQSDDILGKSQKKECSFPRQIAMFLCRSDLHLPFARIGDLFTRDHSTVMTSVKRIEEQTSTRGELASIVHAIRKSL
jgi:chromosomal replication initiator protein